MNKESMPSAVESECAVLAACLLYPRSVIDALPKLEPSDFYDNRNKVIYKAVQQLSVHNNPIDLVTIKQQLSANSQLEDAGGIAYVSSLTEFIPPEANVPHYALEVKRCSIQRLIVWKTQNLQTTILSGNGTATKAIEELKIALAKYEDSNHKEIANQFIEVAAEFLSVVDPPVKYLVGELLPQSTLALVHGEPRTRKSWAMLEIAIAIATGTPAFGLDRFNIPCALPVLYSSQEDAAREVRIRANAILKGKGINNIPDTLFFSVHKGINVESSEWQEALIREISKHEFSYVGLDPVRRFAPNSDKGPSEVRAITGYFRRIIVETGTTLNAGHHDTKPPTDNRDERRRGHKASGGDWFAAADCPIAFESAGENLSLVVPEDYKFSTDPQAFTFRLETDSPTLPTWAKLIGTTSTVHDVKILAAEEKVITYLAEHPGGACGSAITKGCRARREDIISTLEILLKNGKVDCIGLPGKGKRKTWFLSQSNEKIEDSNDFESCSREREQPV